MALHGTGPPIGEPDWRRLVVASLKELNANVTMVPGAKLRQQVVEAGLREGLDVAAAIAGDDRSFLQAVAAVDGVVVTRVPGSDAFVGLGGAKPPDQIASASPAALDGLRSDVYRAFTRVASIPFVYQPERDLFSPEDRAEGASVPVPRVDLPYLIELRRKFALQVPPQQQQRLIDALDGSANPLAQFRQVLEADGLVQRWMTFLTSTLRRRVEEWAVESNVTLRAAWFRAPRGGTNARTTLERLAQYLTDEEIRDLRVPLRAVEAMLFDRKRG